MRVMLIDDDPRYRALLRHHLTCTWPDAVIVAYNPAIRGPLSPEFLAQGFDAVLLDHAWDGGSGSDWLADLGARTGFAPVILLVPADDPELVDAARLAGAFSAVPIGKVQHERLIASVRAASRLQVESQARWRESAEGQEAQRFGGARIPGYRRVRRLASGSVSDLYLAESIEAGEMVALKVTRDARRLDGVDQTFERFLQEYEIVRSVRHPHVVHIHDLGITDDFAYLVMEYFARGDLRAQMRQGPLPPLRALRYAREIAEALAAIHGAGILHRDLKPGNVMVRDDGSLALIDFGLAKHKGLEMEITDKGLIFGTPHYMSPEQGHGQPTDARSDLYSLGVVLHEMLTGAKPFNADNPMAIIYQHAKAPRPSLPSALESLQSLVDRLMATQPSERFGSAAEAEQALSAAFDDARRAQLAA